MDIDRLEQAQCPQKSKAKPSLVVSVHFREIITKCTLADINGCERLNFFVKLLEGPINNINILNIFFGWTWTT